MDSKNNARIRSLILDCLYENETKKPGKDSNVSREELQKYLNHISSADVEENIMDFNVYYLRDKHLIKLDTFINRPHWAWAKITHLGIEKAEYH